MFRLLFSGSMFAAMLLSNISSAATPHPPALQPKQPSGLFAHKSIDQAWKAAVTGNKPLLVMFTSDGCIYCKKMLKTYHHPTIQKMLVGNTESVLAHASQYHDLIEKLGIRGFPTTMLVSPAGEVLDFMPGYVEPKAFAERIDPILQKSRASDDSASSSVAVRFVER